MIVNSLNFFFVLWIIILQNTKFCTINHFPLKFYKKKETIKFPISKYSYQNHLDSQNFQIFKVSQIIFHTFNTLQQGTKETFFETNSRFKIFKYPHSLESFNSGQKLIIHFPSIFIFEK